MFIGIGVGSVVSWCCFCPMWIVVTWRTHNVFSIVMVDLITGILSLFLEILLFGCSQGLFNVIRRCKAVLNYSGYFRTQGEAIVSEIFKGYQAFTKVSHSNMFLVYFSLGLWKPCYSCNAYFYWEYSLSCSTGYFCLCWFLLLCIRSASTVG